MACLRRRDATVTIYNCRSSEEGRAPSHPADDAPEPVACCCGVAQVPEDGTGPSCAYPGSRRVEAVGGVELSKRLVEVACHRQGYALIGKLLALRGSSARAWS